MTVDRSTHRRKRLGPLAAVLLGLVVSACSVSNPKIQPGEAAGSQSKASREQAATDTASTGIAAEPAPKRQTVRIGLLLPLSAPGQTAVLAEMMKKAAELAIFDLDAQHVQLTVKDEKGSPEGARAAADDLVAARTELILGPLFAKSVTSAASSARAANIPMIAFSTDRQVAGQGVHLLSFLAGPEIQRVVSYATQQGKRRFAALIPDDPYGRTAEATFRDAVARNGGTVVALEHYPAQPNAMVEPVNRLRDAMRGIEEHGDPIDALFLPGGEDTLVSLAPLLKQSEIDPAKLKIIGTGGLDYANAGRDAMLVGAWFAGPDPRGWKDFSEKFAKAHGHAPPRIASLTYDAVGVAAALSGGVQGARFIPSNLTRPGGFTGVDGAFRLLADGTTERALAILEVQKFGSGVVEPAPASLGGPGIAAEAAPPARRVPPVN